MNTCPNLDPSPSYGCIDELLFRHVSNAMIDNLWNGLWISKLFVPQAAWFRGVAKLFQNVRQTILVSGQI